MNTLALNSKRMIPWLAACVVAVLVAPPAVQARPSIASLDAKLDVVDGKLDMLLADNISGGGVVPVTLVQRVSSNTGILDRTGDTTVTRLICIGTDACTNSDAALADRIRQGSSEVLVVTSVTASLFIGSLPPPPADGYSLLTLGACQSASLAFPRRLGIPEITVDGRSTTHVTLQPGAIIGDLNATQRLCFTGFAKSTQDIDVTLHGYLTARP